MAARPELRIFHEARELAAEAADLFVWLGGQAIRSAGRCRVALSGGSTPRALYEQLTVPALARQLDWAKVDFFFGDERGVPPDHPESNFGTAHEALFRPLGIAPERIFRMPGEAADIEAAAHEYEAVLRRELRAPAPAIPRFDLILLGLGEDGHTASLFPGAPALEERTRLVVPARSPKGIPQRLTVTVPVVNQAASVVFLVSGPSKAEAVRHVLEDPADSGRWPAKLVQPAQGRLLWFLDQPAASQLTVAKRQIVSHEE